MGEAMIGRKSAPVAVAAFPLFEYETNVVGSGVDDHEWLDRYLNAKALQGWRVHTCQRVGEGRYFVVLDRFLRELTRERER